MERSLKILDGAALVRDAEAALDALRAAIEVCERQIREHEGIDAPLFRRWHSAVCADLLTVRREVEAELRRLQGRLARVHAFRELTGCSEGEAFFWVDAAERGGGALPPRIRRLWEQLDRAERAPNGRKPWTVAGEESAADFAGNAPDLFTGGVDAPMGGWRDGAGEGSDNEAFGDEGAAAEQEAGLFAEDVGRDRVKTLYRRIVRRLHPDVAGPLSASELELWHRTQAAYEAGDLLELDLILARCDRVGTKGLCFSELLALVAETRHRAELLKTEVARLASGPAWRFAACSRVRQGTLRVASRGQLEFELSLLVRERDALSHRLARMRLLAERWRSRRRGEPGQLRLLV